MTNYDVVKKLIGEITPVGETNEDNKRFENLQAMCRLMDEIDTTIQDLVCTYRNHNEYSIKKSVDFANKFLIKIKACE